MTLHRFPKVTVHRLAPCRDVLQSPRPEGLRSLTSILAHVFVALLDRLSKARALLNHNVCHCSLQNRGSSVSNATNRLECSDLPPKQHVRVERPDGVTCPPQPKPWRTVVSTAEAAVSRYRTTEVAQ